MGNGGELAVGTLMSRSLRIVCLYIAGSLIFFKIVGWAFRDIFYKVAELFAGKVEMKASVWSVPTLLTFYSIYNHVTR